MTAEPVNKYFGTPLSEWIDRIPNELEMDAVGFWQIIADGRDGFELTGDMLRDYVRRALAALLKRGAVPVLPSCEEGVFWVPQDSYGNNVDSMVCNIIDEWERAGVDPDHDGLWFALLDS